MTIETRQFSGRKKEIRELRESLAAPQSAVLVSGDPGSGRSALLDATRSRAAIRTAVATPHPSESNHPFAGISVVLNAIGDPRIAEFVGRFVLVDDSVSGTFAAASDLLLLLRGNSLEETLLIIDDADQFDTQTQLALAFMAARLTGTNLRMLASVSKEAASGVFAGIHCVELTNLDTETALTMARGRRPDADEHVLEIVVEWSGGRPSMIADTLDSLSEDQLRGIAPLQLPLFPGGLAANNHGPDPETLALLRRVSSARVNSTSAFSENRLLFEELTSAGVVEVSGPFVGIRDQALRSILYWSMDPQGRDEIHRQAAEEESERQPGLAYWHLEHCDGEHRDPRELIHQAAKLFEEGLSSAAIELVERGIMLSPDLEVTAEALLDLCERLLSLGKYDSTQRYLKISRALARTPRAAIRVEKLEIIRQSLAEDQLDIGAVQLHARRFGLDDPESSADLLTLASAHLVTRFDVAEARALATEALEMLSGENQRASSCIQHWTTRFVNALDDTGVPLPVPQTKLGSQPDALELPTRIVAGRALSYEEKYDDARRILAPLRPLFHEADQPSVWSFSAAAAAAENEVRAGRVRDAVAIIDTVEAASGPRNSRNVLLLGWRALATGCPGDVEPFIDELRSFANASQSSMFRARLHAFEGAHAMLLGNFDSAADLLGRAHSEAPGLRPGILRVEADLVDALRYSGEVSAAATVGESLASRHGRNPSDWSRVALARVRASMAPEDLLGQEYDKAIASALKMDSQLEAARTRLSYSRALEWAGEHGRAGEMRELAAYGLESLGATGMVRAIRSEFGLGASSPQHFLLSTLTESELAVLRLMHTGVRNKDIAAALFVSLRTVEVRITQIYRKLEARSRSHLLTLVASDIDRAVGRQERMGL